MADLVPITFDTDGNMLSGVDAVQSRKVVSNLVTSLELKGGEGPNLWFPKDAQIMPMYIIGIDPSVSIPIASTPAFPVRTTAANANITLPVNNGSWFGTAITVPDGANRYMLSVSMLTSNLAGAFVMGIDGSADGITWFSQGYAQVLMRQRNALYYNAAAATGKFSNYLPEPTNTGKANVEEYDFALPKFIRAALWNGDAGATTATMNVTLTVS